MQMEDHVKPGTLQVTMKFHKQTQLLHFSPSALYENHLKFLLGSIHVNSLEASRLTISDWLHTNNITIYYGT